ncbi:flagellar protein FlaG [Anaerosacchariphilus polymeriproducens]|uniref:Flagellar biosynthesis protein FlaG n=1 Tax=Anaerosacchariphilus polymeriproducens TaxID=1812858 RepID=A0A371AR38_9FIRM|nr:flagellar protein FlaG [Anaerosacchariphilus polymeriproducens]RDU21900.1 flagellar biosynthesis protein FlaG [Anaerosacchariphilus polymeriproducens]
MAIDAVNNNSSLTSLQRTSTVQNQKDSFVAAVSMDAKENIEIDMDERIENTSEDIHYQPSQNTEQLKKAVENINRKMDNSEAIFGIHDETNRIIIKIVDKETKEVIKELPPEKTLDMIAKAWELAGLLVDEKR